MGDWRSLAGMLLCTAVILYLAYWFTRRFAHGYTARATRHMQVYDRLTLGPNKSLLVARVGQRWFVLGVANERISLLAELTEEQAQPWQDGRVPGQAQAPKFADILSDILRGKNKKP